MSRHPAYRRAHRRPGRIDRPAREDGPYAWLKALRNRPAIPAPEPIWTLIDTYDPLTGRPTPKPR